MKEIDDRYPEYARPYEPVKGKKKYKELKYSGSLLAVSVLPVIFFSFFTSPEPPEVKTPEPVVMAVVTPEPTPEIVPDEPIVLDEKTPEPTVKPTATPKTTATPKPTVKPTATTKPTASVKPTTTPKPTATPLPATTPTPTLTPSPTSKPTPTSTPKPTSKPDPTSQPTPTSKPSPTPTSEPSPTPTTTPTPTESPTPTPTDTPTPEPTEEPTPVPITHQPPEIHVNEEMSVLYEDGIGRWMNYKAYEVTMNDAWDGEANVQLKVEGASTGSEGYAEYDSSGAQEGEVWWNEVIYTFPDLPGKYDKKKATLTLNYKTKNGASGTVESDPFMLYAGDYVVDRNVTYDGREVVFTYTIDTSAVNMNAVDAGYTYFAYENENGSWVNRETPDSIDKNGNQVTVRYTAQNIPDGAEFSAFTEFAVNEGTGSVWTSFQNWNDETLPTAFGN